MENFKTDFWLDLKINDIPQTALSAVDSLKDLKKCKYLTVHVNGGLEMSGNYNGSTAREIKLGLSGCIISPEFLS